MPEAINFSLKSIEDVAWVDLNTLTQTRKTYQPEGLEELSRAIESFDQEGRPQHELFHPIMVNLLDADAAAGYVDDLNLCHGTSHRFEDLRPRPDGRYAVIIAGHRRYMATGGLIEKYGADPAQSTLPCSVYENLSFREALRRQIDENMHQQLSVTETARAIQATYNYGIATGEYSKISDCIRDLPFGETKIRNALRFCELPDLLQDWVEGGHLPYGAAVALHPMMEGIQSRHHDLPAIEREKVMYEYMIAYALKIMNNQWSAGTVRSQVGDLIESWRKESDLVLFQADPYKIALQHRHRATRALFDGGLWRLRQFAETNMFQDMPPEQREAMASELEGLLRVIGSTASASAHEKPLLEYVG